MVFYRRAEDIFFNPGNCLEKKVYCVQIRVRSTDSLKTFHSHSPSGRWEKSRGSPRRWWEEGNEDDEKEKHCWVRTAWCLGSAAYPESWRTLEKRRNKEKPDLHSVLWLHFLLCLFTHTLPSCVFVSVSYFFLFVTTPVALKVHVFFQTCSMYMF